MIAFLLLLQLGSSPITKPVSNVEIYGNLVRVNVNQTEINPADTVENWHNIIRGTYISVVEFNKSFHTKNKRYFEYSNYEQWFDRTFYGGKLIQEGSDNHWSTFEFTDFLTPFMYGGKNIFTESGVWIISGEYSNVFVSNDDSVSHITYSNDFPSNKLRLINIAGKVDGKYLISTNADPENPSEWKVNYYLASETDFPYPDSGLVQFGSTDSTLLINDILQVSTDLFLVKTVLLSNPIFMKRTGNELKYLKNANVGYYFGGLNKFVNNQLWTMDYKTLVRYNFNPADITFSGPETVKVFPGDQLSADQDFSNIVFIDSDTLNIYNLEQGKITHKWSLKGFNVKWPPFIDGNDVFFHQITRKVVSVTDNAQKPDQFSVSVYPNPFNPSATIKVTSSSPGVTTFSVVDLLGRQVLSLPDQNLSEGINEITLNAGTLSSGLYFLKVTSGTKNQTVKLMLMK